MWAGAALAWLVAAGLVLGCGGKDGSASGPDDAAAAPTGADAAADSGPLTPDPGTAPADISADPGEGADAGGAPSDEPVDLVNPFIGTGAAGFSFGALFPGATLPFGMVRLSPDTTADGRRGLGVLHAGGYLYQDDFVEGFSHTHLAGVGVADYGNLLVVPSLGDPASRTQPVDRMLPLDHEREHAEPGYYRLDTESGLRAELTATLRTGVHRYTWPAHEQALLVFDITHALGRGTAEAAEVHFDADRQELSGRVHTVGEFTSRFGGFELFFVARVDRPWHSQGVIEAGAWRADAVAGESDDLAAVIAFDSRDDADVELQVGISFVDLDGARRNLDAEADGRSFDDVRAAARATWVDALSVVSVEGGTPQRRALLYTMLYRSQMMPTLLTDVDGRYRGITKQIHTAEGFTYYSDLSLWDTYRTFHPLAVVLFPDQQRDFLRSLMAMGEQGGSFPRWPLATGYAGSMLGTSADVVIADSVTKGMAPIDVAAAYAIARPLATGRSPINPATGGTNPDRAGITDCVEVGWCPADRMGASVSRTLEYALDDYCLMRLAETLGEDEDAAFLAGRADAWKHLYDPGQGFLAPRNADGTFAPYDPSSRSDPFVEGTAWHYLFMVPHDVEGLVEVLGGPAAFVDRLSTFMELGRDTYDPIFPNRYYWHGNEPDLLASFLFGYGGRPDLARAWPHWVADNAYGLHPEGLAGNDDGGTLAAWYVFAAAGIYPLPCTGRYVLSTPLFERVEWQIEGGSLVFERDPDPAATPRIGDEPVTTPFVTHDQLAPGATLTLPASPGVPTGR